MALMTKSLEDYLEAIYLRIVDDGIAQVSDVAVALSVKMPSVVKAIRELKRKGLVAQKPYSDITLTAKGKRVAAIVLGRHRLLKEFLQSLGVSEKRADRDACLMEHILSEESLNKIRDYTKKEGIHG